VIEDWDQAMRSPRTPRLAKTRQNRKPSLEQLHLDSEPLAKTVADILKGWLDGQLPESCKEGTNGVYFFKDTEGKKAAVFKPIDEEGMRPMSPRMSRSPRTPRLNRFRVSEIDTNKPSQETIPQPKPTRPKPSIDCIREFPLDQLNLIKASKTSDVNGHGIPAGEATMREVAASLIDQDGFYGVPKTAIVKIHHWETLGMKRALLKFPKLLDVEGITKIGSLQEFIDNDGSSEDVSPSFFPVDEVHKIGILDLHLMNVDRNEGNILIKKLKDETKCTYELIPIDHGFCIPKYTQIDGTYWAWLNWPQSKEPFSPKMMKHIESIDVDHDALILKSQLGIDNDCLRSMKISTLLLKRGVSQGLVLYDLGNFACRSLDDFDTPSALERVIAQTDEKNPANDEEFFTLFEPLLDAALQVFKSSSDS
jgi:hypothetical protein